MLSWSPLAQPSLFFCFFFWFNLFLDFTFTLFLTLGMDFGHLMKSDANFWKYWTFSHNPLSQIFCPRKQRIKRVR